MLDEAVVTEDLLSPKSFFQRLFAKWFDALVYNQIWEDPHVDLQALELDEKSRVLTISSGGCNALNYLLAGPEDICAVDLNRYHIFLLRLKAAALRALPSYEDFFNFFGTGKHPNNGRNYFRHVRGELNAETRDFWDQKIGYFASGGLYNNSRNGYFLRFFHTFSRLIGCRPDMVLTAETFSEQSALFEKHIMPFFDSRVIRGIGKLPVTMFGLGIPPQQYDELKRDLENGRTVIDVYRERVRRLACDFPINENYFAWQAFDRRYDTESRFAVPEYLKAENYARLRNRIDRLTTEVGSVTETIRHSPRRSFNRFVFLDAQDWMSAEALTGLWSEITANAVAGSRIIFRTAGSASPVDRRLPAELRRRFTYERERSADLFRQDRASIYGGFHLYVFNG